MGQIVKHIVGIDVLPTPIRQFQGLADTWTGSSLPNGYTKITADNGIGEALSKIVLGYGRDNLIGNNPYYNDPAQLGGQTTPNTAWLSPAQDDSWAPRYQTSGQYQVTTQVPTQQTPFMTHVYSTLSTYGIWRIAYVIDDNNFVVYDPQQTANNAFAVNELVPVCQNMFAMTKIVVEGDASAAATIHDAMGAVGGPLGGPFRLEFGPNQEGIVEPFLVENTAGNITAIMTF
jgi:hypothetical protein